MFRRLLVALMASVISLGFFLAGTGTAHAMTYDEYVPWTNSVLDRYNAEKGSSAGFRAARALFNVPKYSKASWDGAAVLCRFFRGDSTASAGRIAAEAVWPTERALLDSFRSAGGAVFDWGDFMLVRFTVLASAVNAQCPSYNSLMMGPFSESLYGLFDAYRASQGGTVSTTPTPRPTATPQPSPLPQTPTPASPSPSSSNSNPNMPYGVVSALTKPVFLKSKKAGKYTEIYFPMPNVWDTWGINFSAHFANSGRAFCGWMAVVGQSAPSTTEGYCSAWTPSRLKGKTVKMFLRARSDLGVSESDPFYVTFR